MLLVLYVGGLSAVETQSLMVLNLALLLTPLACN